MITKKIYVLILFCSVLLSCKKDIINGQKINKINNKQKFIEDNFLKIVDTVAYSRGTFITTPSD